MSDYLIKGETLTSIANAIRGKKGSTSPIKTQDFATEIEGIQAGGGGESGVPIEVTELPQATADTVGKVYLNTTDGNYYVGKQSTDFILDEPLGNKIYFDTTKNPVDYGEGGLLAASNGTTDYALLMIDVLALLEVTGYGHSYVLLSTSDMSSFLGVAYVSCDVLNVEQFNQMVGSQFGLTITEFGWQTDVFDVSAIADYVVTQNNLEDWDYLAYGEAKYYWSNQVDELIQGKTKSYTSSINNMRACAFSDSAYLRSVSFPNLVNIPHDAFSNCQKLTTANIPNATSIGSYAFFYCVRLTTASFPNATSIGTYAFEYCRALTTANIPNATSIENSAFNGCNALTTASFPNVTSIGEQAFFGCTALTTADFPNVTSIEGYGAFGSCSVLTTADFPNVTSLGSYVFQNCRALTTVNLPNATSIEDGTFYNCYSLTKLIIGTKQSSVCTLSNTNAFAYCYHILGIKDAIYNPEGLKDGYIYVKADKVAETRTATNWVTYASQIMPWVATREELDNIDNTLYDHACVGENGAEYIYTGDRWRIFR